MEPMELVGGEEGEPGSSSSPVVGKLNRASLLFGGGEVAARGKGTRSALLMELVVVELDECRCTGAVASGAEVDATLVREVECESEVEDELQRVQRGQ